LDKHWTKLQNQLNFLFQEVHLLDLLKVGYQLPDKVLASPKVLHLLFLKD